MTKQINTQKKITPEADVQHAAEVLSRHNGVKSPAIRELLGEWAGDKGRVARALNIRYQHVRNVAITPIKKVSK
jgi:hypothetical protein